jgi:3-hydroxyisobutyrate dehydrogenase-like beta-hydroxyacid dehydrogenase
VDYGEDTGSANVVKLCGNFLIAVSIPSYNNPCSSFLPQLTRSQSSIEAIAESMALAEKHGVERTEVMKLLSSTIFDCLIYKVEPPCDLPHFIPTLQGYGQRVSERDHRPGGFSLDLGLKDVTLVSQAAREADTPMPFLSVLLDRFTSAKARGRGQMDWSAIGMSVGEDAGIEMQSDIDRNSKAVREGDLYK